MLLWRCWFQLLGDDFPRRFAAERSSPLEAPDQHQRIDRLPVVVLPRRLVRRCSEPHSSGRPVRFAFAGGLCRHQPDGDPLPDVALRLPKIRDFDRIRNRDQRRRSPAVRSQITVYWKSASFTTGPEERSLFATLLPSELTRTQLVQWDRTAINTLRMPRSIEQVVINSRTALRDLESGPRDVGQPNHSGGSPLVTVVSALRPGAPELVPGDLPVHCSTVVGRTRSPVNSQ